MVWPFGSSDPGKDKKVEAPEKPTIPLINPVTEPESYAALKQWGPAVLLSLVSLGALQLYVNYVRRIPSSAYIRPNFFRNRSIFGRVTSVGDGDNFHMFHTPGGRALGWGWLRRIPQTRKELKGHTIPIRIAGIDAPENGHFGKPAQPFAPEALKWLSDYILNHNLRAYIYRRDQYERVVATVYIRRFLFRKDVGYEMLKRGLATTYEAKMGAEFGGMKEKYEQAMAKAKKKRRGIWSGKAAEFESPREYKTKWADKKDVS